MLLSWHRACLVPCLWRPHPHLSLSSSGSASWDWCSSEIPYMFIFNKIRSISKFKQIFSYLLIFINRNGLEKLTGNLRQERAAIRVHSSHRPVARAVRLHRHLKLLYFGLNIAHKRWVGLFKLPHVIPCSAISALINKRNILILKINLASQFQYGLIQQREVNTEAQDIFKNHLTLMQLEDRCQSGNLIFDVQI